MGASDQAMDGIQERIRRGAFDEARPLILKLSVRRLTREQRLRLAHLANQSFLPTRTITLLGRLVRPGKGSASRATPEERVEYARALSELGCQREAIDLLSPLDPGRLHRVAAALSFAHFRRWEWKTTIPYLKRVLDAPGVSGRIRLLLDIRYATALLHGANDPGGAARILEPLIRGSNDKVDRRLRIEALGMFAQTHFFEKRWNEALQALEEREALFKDANDAVFALNGRKWRALIGMSRAAAPQAGLGELLQVSEGYRALGNWEQVRSCEYYAAALLKDEKRVTRFCFGTPYPAAREKLLRVVGMSPDRLPEVFTVDLGPAGAKRARIAVLDGANPFSEERLKPGQALQRMLHALVRDAFAPPTAMVLHERLYPGDFFNPASSPFRVSQVLKRLRRWLDDAKIPIVIDEANGFYRLMSDRPLSLELRRATELTDEGDGRLDALTIAFKSPDNRPFRATEVEARLNLKRSAAVSLLRDAIADGRIERVGVGSGIRYRLRGSET